MAHRNYEVNPIVAHIDNRAPERNRLGTDRHAPEIGIKINAGEDFSRARAQSRADLLPVVAIAAFDRCTRRHDQFLIRLG
jgi:hypothetical protein